MIIIKICRSCTIYIVFFVLFFYISVSISSVFIYFDWCLKRKHIETTIYQMQFCWTYKGEISSKLILKIVHFYFFNDMVNIKDFDSRLIKVDQTSYKNIGIYNIGYITIDENKKNWWLWK